MSLFMRQPVICCICGRHFETDFNYCGGFCCCIECRQEWEWRKTLYICGEKYHPKINEEAQE